MVDVKDPPGTGLAAVDPEKALYLMRNLPSQTPHPFINIFLILAGFLDRGTTFQLFSAQIPDFIRPSECGSAIAGDRNPVLRAGAAARAPSTTARLTRAGAARHRWLVPSDSPISCSASCSSKWAISQSCHLPFKGRCGQRG